jgi:hypothetical protein
LQPEAHVQLQPDVTEASVEIALDGSYKAPNSDVICDGPDDYMTVESYLVGALAVHWKINADGDATDQWRVSHIGTGMSLWEGDKLETAFGVARAADRAIDWSRVTRTEFVRWPAGWTDDVAAQIRRAADRFRRSSFPAAMSTVRSNNMQSLLHDQKPGGHPAPGGGGA